MEHYQDIFDFIIRQETAFKKPITLNTKSWNLNDHIVRSSLYRDSEIVGTKTDFTPINNITRPILNLQYRTEDIDVKDVEIYVNNKAKYHLSFLVKKYHDDVFVVENDLDTYFDQLNQSRIDFGAGISKSLRTPAPEVVPLQSIAFCDQRDILSRPIGLKHSYAPDELMAMGSKGWGSKSNGATAMLKEVIVLARDYPVKDTSEGDIQVYEVHGNLPKKFVDINDDSEEYESRLFICCFYQKKDSMEKNGIILYTAPETESPFKLIKRDPIYGRAVGFGGAEELFEAQVWVNYDMIRMQGMLDSASKTILGAVGPNSATIAQKNNINNMQNNEIMDLGQSDLKVIDTTPRNMQLFQQSVALWSQQAKEIGAAQDPLQGNEPNAGTPFSSLQAQIQQGMGLHDYRRGQFAKHLEEIYQDWIIPHIEKKICEGMTFLSELSLEELQYVTESLVTCEIEKVKKEFVLSNGGQAMTPEQVTTYEESIRTSIKKKGNKVFIEILKNEFKDAPLAVKVSIAGKSKNLGKATDTIVNILRFAFSNPQGFAMTMQIPGMASAFNQIIEYAGLSPVDFSDIGKLAQQTQQPQQPNPQQPQQSPQQAPQQQPALAQ